MVKTWPLWPLKTGFKGTHEVFELCRKNSSSELSVRGCDLCRWDDEMSWKRGEEKKHPLPVKWEFILILFIIPSNQPVTAQTGVWWSNDSGILANANLSIHLSIVEEYSVCIQWNIVTIHCGSEYYYNAWWCPWQSCRWWIRCWLVDLVFIFYLILRIPQ